MAHLRQQSTWLCIICQTISFFNKLTRPCFFQGRTYLIRDLMNGRTDGQVDLQLFILINTVLL